MWNGVFDLGYAMQQLRDIGITLKPVSLGEYYECKFGEDGEPSKRKARIPVQLKDTQETWRRVCTTTKLLDGKQRNVSSCVRTAVCR